MKRMLLSTMLIVIIMLSMFSGCTDQNPNQNDDNNDETDKATIKINIGDNPLENLTNFNVRFKSITFIPENDNKENQTIYCDNIDIDLMLLQKRNLTQEIAKDTIEATKYKGFTLSIHSANIIYQNQSSYIPVIIPEKNVTMMNSFTLQKGLATLAIYIDLNQSVFKHENQYTFVPIPHLLYLIQEDDVGRYVDGDEVLVQNRPPIIPGIIIDDALEYNKIISSNETVNLSASTVFDVDGDEISYQWDFGDNTTASGKKVAHQYTTDGEYVVTLTVSDGMHSASATVGIGVGIKSDP